MTLSQNEFSKLVDPTAWWMRCGSPKWLNDPRWYVRAIRASAVLGLLGIVSAGLSTISVMASEEGIFFAPGLWFGLLTLIPLSRWLGRGWILTLLAVPISVLAWLCSGLVFVIPALGKIMGGPAPEPPPFLEYLSSFVGSLIVSAWIGNPLKKQSWFACLLAVTLATSCCGQVILLTGNITENRLSVCAMHLTFQCAMAIGLGARLWLEKPAPGQRHLK